MVTFALISSKTVVFGLVDFECASSRWLYSRLSRRELLLEARPKILDQLLAESCADVDCLPTYNQATKIYLSSVDKCVACTSTLLCEYDMPLTMPNITRTENNLLIFKGQEIERDRESGK